MGYKRGGMETKKIALVTARAARRLDDDLAPLEAALRGAGAEADLVDWDDAAADWPAYDLALLRSPWDYSKRLAEFLAWAVRVTDETLLLNPVPVLRWNTDKHYLAELAHAGVPVVPSHFIEPGESGASGLQRFFSLHPDVPEFVAKPAVGVGSRDARRFAHDDFDAAIAHVQRLLDARRSVLLQPYLGRIEQHGETSLVFIEGEFSHAVRKGPLLKRGEPPVSALVRKEILSAREPDVDELRAASGALAAQPFGALLYSRVDLLRDDAGVPRVLELELTEPTMFFALACGSADRFAAAIVEATRHRAQ
jgi:hypothetical protein